jgi:VanZ family protein
MRFSRAASQLGMAGRASSLWDVVLTFVRARLGVSNVAVRATAGAPEPYCIDSFCTY